MLIFRPSVSHNPWPHTFSFWYPSLMVTEVFSRHRLRKQTRRTTARPLKRLEFAKTSILELVYNGAPEHAPSSTAHAPNTQHNLVIKLSRHSMGAHFDALTCPPQQPARFASGASFSLMPHAWHVCIVYIALKAYFDADDASHPQWSRTFIGHLHFQSNLHSFTVLRSGPKGNNMYCNRTVHVRPSAQIKAHGLLVLCLVLCKWRAPIQSLSLIESFFSLAHSSFDRPKTPLAEHSFLLWLVSIGLKEVKTPSCPSFHSVFTAALKLGPE